MIRTDSATIIKVLNAVFSLSEAEERINFTNLSEDSLCIFTETLRFTIKCEGSIEPFSLENSNLKGVSSLKASLVDEYLTISNEEEENVIIKSNIEFSLVAGLILVDLPEEVVQETYTPGDDLKVLSRFLSKFSKDNFKGSLLFTDKGFIIPGEYHITELESSFYNPEELVEKDDRVCGDTAYSIKATELNKILKLGQDLCISKDGLIYSSGDIVYQVQLPLADRKALVGLEIDKLRDLFSDDLPMLEIQEPKLFKDFIKNTKSLDKLYDLCRIQTEESRINLSFYRDKVPSSKFVYSNVDTPENYIEFFLQVKHITAISELATKSLKIYFSSSNDPLKVVIDDQYVSYIMQCLVA